MPSVLSSILALLVSLFKSSTSLCLEHFLRHQVAVINGPPVALGSIPLIASSGRGCHVCGPPGDALVFVQPVVLAQRQGRFHDHWRRLSQRRPGRLSLPRRCTLIREWSVQNLVSSTHRRVWG